MNSLETSAPGPLLFRDLLSTTGRSNATVGIWATAGGSGHALLQALLDVAIEERIPTGLVSPTREVLLEERGLAWDPTRRVYRSRDGNLALLDSMSTVGPSALMAIDQLQADTQLLIVDEPMWLRVGSDRFPLRRLAHFARENSRTLVVLASSTFLASHYRGWLLTPEDRPERLRRLRSSMEVVFHTTGVSLVELRAGHRQGAGIP